MKLPENFFRAFGREKTLNVRNDENQDAEQHHNFYHIIDEKLRASADFFRGVKTDRIQQIADKTVQPSHSENFILKEIPD